MWFKFHSVYHTKKTNRLDVRRTKAAVFMSFSTCFVQLHTQVVFIITQNRFISTFFSNFAVFFLFHIHYLCVFCTNHTQFYPFV